MPNKFQRMLLLSVFSLLIISPTPSFAWRDYKDYWSGYGDWDYHGSGRDYSYSYYIDNYYYRNNAFTYTMLPQNFGDDDIARIMQTPLTLDAQQNVFTVNIPNERGGYTPVIIKRSGNGFTGPQGEFYPEFPKVSQLRIMYGK